MHGRHIVSPGVVTLNGAALWGTRNTDRERKQMLVHAKQLPLRTLATGEKFITITATINRREIVKLTNRFGKTLKCLPPNRNDLWTYLFRAFIALFMQHRNSCLTFMRISAHNSDILATCMNNAETFQITQRKNSWHSQK